MSPVYSTGPVESPHQLLSVAGSASSASSSNADQQVSLRCRPFDIIKDALRATAVCMVAAGVLISLLFVVLFIPTEELFLSSSSPAIHGLSQSLDFDAAQDIPRWLEQFGSSVPPRPCHSHNDYWRAQPLFSALSVGCTGIEADVHLKNIHDLDDPGQDLLVGHSRDSLSPNRTLESMYLDPLLELFSSRSTGNGTDGGRPQRGLFDLQPETPITLLIDVKDHAEVVWPIVLEKLEPFRQKHLLRRYDVGSEAAAVEAGPLIVVGSGALREDIHWTASDAFNRTYRDTFFDSLLPVVWQYAAARPMWNGERNPMAALNLSQNSYYSSASFPQCVGSTRFGFSDKQIRQLQFHIRQARSAGLEARYWDTPAWPPVYRDYVWEVLTQEGVGMLNVDDLNRATRGPWSTGYLDRLVWMLAGSVGIALIAVGTAGIRYRGIRRKGGKKLF